MKTALRLFLFILVFVLDVRVKADIVALPNAREVAQEPDGCLLAASVCALKTTADEKFKLRLGESEVVLDASTAVIRQAENEVALLTGTIWVRSKGAFAVRTIYGEVRAPQGEFWVQNSSGRTWVYAIEGALVLEPRAGELANAIRLDPGEENWLGPVGLDGSGSSGVPRAIVPREHIRRWARLYAGTRKQFEQEVRTFHAHWSRVLAGVAEYHQSRAEARRQWLEEEHARALRIKAQEDARSAELRALFRKKNMLD